MGILASILPEPVSHLLAGAGVGLIYHWHIHQSVKQTPAKPGIHQSFALTSLIRFAITGLTLGLLSQGNITTAGWLVLGMAVTHVLWLVYWAKKSPTATMFGPSSKENVKTSNSSTNPLDAPHG